MKPIEILTYLFVTLFAFSAVAAPKAPLRLEGDGKIAIFNFHEKEYVEVQYKDGGRYLPEGLQKISHALRSRGDGTERPIDVRLIELLDLIQDHFGAETVEIISGYRSPQYNKSLIANGRGAASESLHMQGVAADIHLDEIRDEDIFSFVKGLRAGGVGIYPRYAFVHVDVGPPRTWSEAAAPERILVGTELNPNPAWSAVTDKNNYAQGSAVAVTITNNDYGKQRFMKNVWIERFRHGEWSEKQQLEKEKNSTALEPGETAEYKWDIPTDFPFGKYRLVIFASKDFSVPPVFSNEFYVKK